jgi:hypothetical protein
MNKENATRYVSDMVDEAYGHIHMLRRIANDTDTIQAQREAVQGLTWFAELVDDHRRLERFGDDDNAQGRHDNALRHLAAFYRCLSLVTGQYADAMRYKAQGS